MQTHNEEIQARDEATKQAIMKFYLCELSTKTIANAMGIPLAKVEEVIAVWKKGNKA